VVIWAADVGVTEEAGDFVVRGWGPLACGVLAGGGSAGRLNSTLPVPVRIGCSSKDWSISSTVSNMAVLIEWSWSWEDELRHLPDTGWSNSEIVEDQEVSVHTGGSLNDTNLEVGE